jgi:hemoglobin-like flavoprotein
MNDGQLELFRASVNRCVADEAFLQDFYDRFTASSPEVRAKFGQTDMPTQRRALADSLYVIAVAVQGKDTSPSWHQMERIARRHSRAEMDIRPELYDLWLESLMQAVAAHDPQYSPEIDSAWRAVMSEGITFLRSRH